MFMVLGLVPKVTGKASKFIKSVLIRGFYSRAVRLGPMETINQLHFGEAIKEIIATTPFGLSGGKLKVGE